MLRRLLVTTLLMTVPGVAPALSQTCEQLQAGPSGRVVAVSDGDTVDLDSGLTVRLVGIQAPKLPLGREGFTAWPLGDEAKAATVRSHGTKPAVVNVLVGRYRHICRRRRVHVVSRLVCACTSMEHVVIRLRSQPCGCFPSATTPCVAQRLASMDDHSEEV